MADTTKPRNPGLDIAFKPEQLASLRAKLDPDQFAKAVFQAVRRATRYAVRRLKAEVTERTTLAPKYVKRVLKASEPRKGGAAGEFAGRVEVSRQLIPLAAFKNQVSRGGGASVTVSTDRPPILLRHAFRATVRSTGQINQDLPGHKGIFLRARHLASKGPNENKGKLTKRGFAGRFAIEEAFGPAVIDLISVPAALARIEADVRQKLAREAEGQLSRFLDGKPADAGGDDGGD